MGVGRGNVVWDPQNGGRGSDSLISSEKRQGCVCDVRPQSREEEQWGDGIWVLCGMLLLMMMTMMKVVEVGVWLEMGGERDDHSWVRYCDQIAGMMVVLVVVGVVVETVITTCVWGMVGMLWGLEQKMNLELVNGRGVGVGRKHTTYWAVGDAPPCLRRRCGGTGFATRVTCWLGG